MYIQDRLFFLVFIFSSMLTVSFFLSSITILATQRASTGQIGYLPSIKEQDKTIEIIESVLDASNEPSVEKEPNPPSGAKGSNQLEVLPLAMNNQIEEDLRTSDEVKVNQEANTSSNKASLDKPDESDNEEPDKLYLQSPNSGSPCLDASQNSDSEQLHNSICIELYRDDGDMVPDTNHDSLVGFTVIINQPTINRDYYEFISQSPGYYFAKFYQMGDEVALLRQVARDAPAFNSLDGQIEPTAEQDSATKQSADENEELQTWQPILLEASPVEAGYCVRFESNSDSELLGDVNGITVFQSKNSNVESNGDEDPALNSDLD